MIEAGIDLANYSFPTCENQVLNDVYINSYYGFYTHEKKLKQLPEQNKRVVGIEVPIVLPQQQELPPEVNNNVLVGSENDVYVPLVYVRKESEPESRYVQWENDLLTGAGLEHVAGGFFWYNTSGDSNTIEFRDMRNQLPELIFGRPKPDNWSDVNQKIRPILSARHDTYGLEAFGLARRNWADSSLVPSLTYTGSDNLTYFKAQNVIAFEDDGASKVYIRCCFLVLGYELYNRVKTPLNDSGQIHNIYDLSNDEVWDLVRSEETTNQKPYMLWAPELEYNFGEYSSTNKYNIGVQYANQAIDDKNVGVSVSITDDYDVFLVSQKDESGNYLPGSHIIEPSFSWIDLTKKPFMEDLKANFLYSAKDTKEEVIKDIIYNDLLGGDVRTASTRIPKYNGAIFYDRKIGDFVSDDLTEDHQKIRVLSPNNDEFPFGKYQLTLPASKIQYQYYQEDQSPPAATGILVCSPMLYVIDESGNKVAASTRDPLTTIYENEWIGLSMMKPISFGFMLVPYGGSYQDRFTIYEEDEAFGFTMGNYPEGAVNTLDVTLEKRKVKLYCRIPGGLEDYDYESVNIYIRRKSYFVKVSNVSPDDKPYSSRVIDGINQPNFPSQYRGTSFEHVDITNIVNENKGADPYYFEVPMSNDEIIWHGVQLNSAGEKYNPYTAVDIDFLSTTPADDFLSKVISGSNNLDQPSLDTYTDDRFWGVLQRRQSNPYTIASSVPTNFDGFERDFIKIGEDFTRNRPLEISAKFNHENTGYKPIDRSAGSYDLSFHRRKTTDNPAQNIFEKYLLFDSVAYTQPENEMGRDSYVREYGNYSVRNADLMNLATFPPNGFDYYGNFGAVFGYSSDNTNKFNDNYLYRENEYLYQEDYGFYDLATRTKKKLGYADDIIDKNQLPKPFEKVYTSQINDFNAPILTELDRALEPDESLIATLDLKDHQRMFFNSGSYASVHEFDLSQEKPQPFNVQFGSAGFIATASDPNTPRVRFLFNLSIKPEYANFDFRNASVQNSGKFRFGLYADDQLFIDREYDITSTGTLDIGAGRIYVTLSVDGKRSQDIVFSVSGDGTERENFYTYNDSEQPKNKQETINLNFDIVSIAESAVPFGSTGKYTREFTVNLSGDDANLRDDVAAVKIKSFDPAVSGYEYMNVLGDIWDDNTGIFELTENMFTTPGLRKIDSTFSRQNMVLEAVVRSDSSFVDNKPFVAEVTYHDGSKKDVNLNHPWFEKKGNADDRVSLEQINVSIGSLYTTRRFTGKIVGLDSNERDDISRIELYVGNTSDKLLFKTWDYEGIKLDSSFSQSFDEVVTIPPETTGIENKFYAKIVYSSQGEGYKSNTPLFEIGSYNDVRYASDTGTLAIESHGPVIKGSYNTIRRSFTFVVKGNDNNIRNDLAYIDIAEVSGVDSGGERNVARFKTYDPARDHLKLIDEVRDSLSFDLTNSGPQIEFVAIFGYLDGSESFDILGSDGETVKFEEFAERTKTDVINFDVTPLERTPNGERKFSIVLNGDSANSRKDMVSVSIHKVVGTDNVPINVTIPIDSTLMTPYFSVGKSTDPVEISIPLGDLEAADFTYTINYSSNPTVSSYRSAFSFSEKLQILTDVLDITYEYTGKRARVDKKPIYQFTVKGSGVNKRTTYKDVEIKLGEDQVIRTVRLENGGEVLDSNFQVVFYVDMPRVIVAEVLEVSYRITYSEGVTETAWHSIGNYLGYPLFDVIPSSPNIDNIIYDHSVDLPRSTDTAIVKVKPYTSRLDFTGIILLKYKLDNYDEAGTETKYNPDNWDEISRKPAASDQVIDFIIDFRAAVDKDVYMFLQYFTALDEDGVEQDIAMTSIEDGRLLVLPEESEISPIDNPLKPEAKTIGITDDDISIEVTVKRPEGGFPIDAKFVLLYEEEANGNYVLTSSTRISTGEQENITFTRTYDR